MTQKIVLIDGNSIINRAFFGLPDLTNSEGIHTNAVYGFVNILLRIISEEEPDYLCVAFDVHAPTFRHKMYAAYKGTRKGMPDELKQQVPILKELLKAMGVLTIEQAGYEADDILGTLARRGERDGMAVTLVSGDRDLLQIATDKILIRIPKTKAGKTEIENYHTQDVIEKYGVTPLQIIELKALMGDSSDNIPGVPKVGEKTATELVKEYGSIENLKEHVSEITKKSIRESLEVNFDMAVLSKTLATIDTDADIDFSYDNAVYANPFTDDAYLICKRLGFKNLLVRFENSKLEENNSNISAGFVTVNDFAKAEEIFSHIKEYSVVGFELMCETIGVGSDRKDTLVGLSLCFKEDEVYFIPAEGMMSSGYLAGRLEDCVLEAEGTVFVTFDLKTQLYFATRLSSIDILKKRIRDLKIGIYLLNPLKNDYEIVDVASEFASCMIKSRNEIFGKLTYEAAIEGQFDDFASYSCYFAYVCKKAYEPLIDKLNAQGMLDLFTNIEMPLCGCLYLMEREGILVVPKVLEEIASNLKQQIDMLEKDIHAEAGEVFNINSPVQLGDILFNKMGLPGGKKTKKGYSTAADVLEKLAGDYPFVGRILEYRALTKLKSTYADGLSTYICADNRIRSRFLQTITATGRISSADPNLQNIPIRMEQGRLIRKAFVPKEGCIFVSADYSQIELRIMAALSSDENLIEAFSKGEDVHRITASKVFHVPFEEVTSLQRRNAKAVNFGIIYGISAFGLAEGISVSKKEAKEFIDEYFITFPKVKSFLDKQVEDARNNGYVTTLFSRRRPLPEISSSNFMQRSFGERVAMNAPIQGTAADIMKIAMINVFERLEQEGLQSRVILQVHDELMIETYVDEQDAVKRILEEEMENAVSLSVPLIVEAGIGNDWYEVK